MTIPHRLLAAVLVAISGSTVMINMVGPNWRDEWQLVLLAGGGAFVAGILCANLFGRPGHGGVGLAVLGALLATAVGAATAGLVLDLVSRQSLDLVLAAPVLIIVSIFTQPAVMFGWVLTMTLVHLASRWIRFTYGLQSPAPGTTP